MDFIDSTLLHKSYFRPEQSQFLHRGEWMLRAKLRPVKGLKTRAEARELAAILNNVVRVALTEYEDNKDLERELNETTVQEAPSQASTSTKTNRSNKARKAKT